MLTYIIFFSSSYLCICSIKYIIDAILSLFCRRIYILILYSYFLPLIYTYSHNKVSIFLNTSLTHTLLTYMHIYGERTTPHVKSVYFVHNNILHHHHYYYYFYMSYLCIWRVCISVYEKWENLMAKHLSLFIFVYTHYTYM